MKGIFIIASIIFCSFTTKTTWEKDFNTAKQKATSEHKYILLNFSGSDWCGPCIRMHKEIFESEKFSNFANQTLVMLNADFPRKKKNQLSKVLQKQNDTLAEQYNKEGNFPFTLLLNSEGKVLKIWNGFPKDGSEMMINDIKQIINAKS